MEFFSEFNLTIHYIPNQINKQADTLNQKLDLMNKKNKIIPSLKKIWQKFTTEHLHFKYNFYQKSKSQQNIHIDIWEKNHPKIKS